MQRDNRALWSAQKCSWAKTVSLGDRKVVFFFVEESCFVQVESEGCCLFPISVPCHMSYRLEG